VAGDEPVTSPDQHKPTVSKRLARFGALATIVILVLMAQFGNHHGNVENIFLYLTAGLLAAIMLGDWLLRKNGLKSD
jgi:Protein of unknown function (DUF2631)